MGAGAASNDSDESLIGRAVECDKIALGVLLSRYEPRLLRYIEQKLPQHLRGSIDAEDVAQETYYRATRSIGTLRSHTPGAFLSWLTTIARNRLYDMIDGTPPPGGQGFGDDSGPNLPVPANHYTPSQSAAAHEEVSAVRKAVLALKTTYGKVIRLRDLEGVSVRTTAKEMQRSVEAVGMLHNRARRKLREKLRTMWQRASDFLV